MQNDLSNTSVPPDELVQFLKLSLDKRIDEYLRRLALFTVQAANLAETSQRLAVQVERLEQRDDSRHDSAVARSVLPVSHLNNASLAQSLEEHQHRLQQARDALKYTQELFERFGSAELKTLQARFRELHCDLETNQAEGIAETDPNDKKSENIVVKPLTQLANIQLQLDHYIEQAISLIDENKNVNSFNSELNALDWDIRELKIEEERETRESRDEHERAARVLTEQMRDRLLKPLTELRNSIKYEVTELYVKRMIDSRAAKIGLPDELDQQYRQLAAEMEQIWQSQKTQLSETLTGLRAKYLDAMNKHAQGIESNLGQMNINLPQLTLDLDFDFSALEDHRQRSAQLNAELARLQEEIDTVESDLDSTVFDQQRRLRAEAEVNRIQRQLENMGGPPAPTVYQERRKKSDWGSGFLWLSATYETVTCKDDSNVKIYERERSELREMQNNREKALDAVIEEEQKVTGRRMSLEAARKRLDRDLAKREKDLQKLEQQAHQDEAKLIEDTLNRLRRNTLNQLNDSIAGVERYLNESLRQVFMEQADMLAGCVREQMLEPLNAKRKQQEDIQILMQQSQEQIAARHAELAAARQALAEVQQLTHDALQPA